jgi:ATP-dependent RNA helicase RhlB
VEDYVHRIGRTARFGASGVAISFICEEYAYSMPDIEDYIDQKIPIKSIDKELLADIIKPEKRTPRPKLVPNKRTKPRPRAS